MPSRGVRWDMQQLDQKVSRPYNGGLKRKERVRRDARLKTLLTKGTFPYTPLVMSWLSAAIDKPTRYITTGDVESFLHPKPVK